MRTTQFVGHKKWTEQFLVDAKIFLYTERTIRIHPDGRLERQPDRDIYESPVKREPSGEAWNGMFEEEVHDLMRYRFPDGRVFVEYVQTIVESSGPVIFLALEDEKGAPVPESLWTEEEIEEYA